MTKAAIAGCDLAYIDEYGMVRTVAAISVSESQNVLMDPRPLNLEKKAKLVSVGFSHGFAVTEDN